MQTKVLLPLLGLLGLTLAWPWTVPSIQAQTATASCPADARFAEMRVAGLLSGGLAAAREHLGFAGADSSNMRLLVDAEDAQACERLRRALEPKMRHDTVLTFYAAGPFYLVPTSQPPLPPGQVRFGHSSVIYVLDEQFNLVSTISG